MIIPSGAGVSLMWRPSRPLSVPPVKPARVPSVLLYESVLHGQVPTGARRLEVAGWSRGSVGALVARYWHYAALLLWAVVCTLAYGHHRGQSWHYFIQGGRSLFCLAGSGAAACGLHVYAAHPELQIGPLSFLVAGMASAGGEDGAELAETVMTLMGLVVLLLVEQDTLTRIRPLSPGRLQRRVLLAGAVF